MTIDLGLALGVDAQSFGQPGERTFRLRLLGSASRLACLWVEKEHLQGLTLALRQVLSQLRHESEPASATAADFPDVADHEFHIGRIGMGFSASDRTVVLQLHELGIGDAEEPTLRVRLTLDQCATLVAQMEEIIAQGRPLCPLCHLPAEPSGHRCVRSNGHSEQPIPDSHADADS